MCSTLEQTPLNSALAHLASCAPTEAQPDRTDKVPAGAEAAGTPRHREGVFANQVRKGFPPGPGQPAGGLRPIVGHEPQVARVRVVTHRGSEPLEIGRRD